LRRHDNPRITIAAMGAPVTEALAAADRLDELGFGADVVCVTSPGLLYRALRARHGLDEGPAWVLEQVFPERRARPLVTVLDGHPHTLAFLDGVHRVPSRNLGVTRFGQSGGLDDVYRYHGLDTDSVVRTCLDLID
jgi:pyruvate dehydrogenase E1 component